MRWERKKQTSVQQIDFLPAHYHEEYARRRTQASRILVICIFAAALPTASLYQYRLRLSVDRQLAEIDQHHSESQADALRLARLNGKLSEENAMAQLAVFLKHPWPHTQILAAIIEPLPESMSLDEVIIHRDKTATKGPATEKGTGKKAATTMLPAAEDLQTLKKQAEGRLVVRLTGLSVDSRQLHDYLSSLGRHQLFTQVELDSMESEPSRDGQKSIARFEAHLVVQPGYGMPGSSAVGQQAQQDSRPEKHVENPS
ncbi:MAG: PilN domain-containing protein [Planctomycetota bacterium]|nr:PilN domain-containing protein [Planctomycetota bacterium]